MKRILSLLLVLLLAVSLTLPAFAAEGGEIETLTRNQLVAILWRMEGRLFAGTGDLSGYPDAGIISPWARKTFARAVGRGVIRGREGGVAPQETAARAEAAQILINMGELEEETSAPAPLEGLSDYIAWAEETGYPSGTLTPMGFPGINQDYYHTPAGSAAYTSGRIVIGDSRCCQLGIYQQRTGGDDFATFAVWGGHYLPELDPPALTEEICAEVEACFRAQIETCGHSAIYLFATVNDFDYKENRNETSIAAAVKAAERFAALSCTVDGRTCHPEVVLIGFDGGRATGTIFGIPQEQFNRYVSDYTRDLRAAVGGSEALRPFASRFTSVPEIVGGKPTYISDGLHYSDEVLAAVVSCLSGGS